MNALDWDLADVVAVDRWCEASTGKPRLVCVLHPELFCASKRKQRIVLWLKWGEKQNGKCTEGRETVPVIVTLQKFLFCLCHSTRCSISGERLVWFSQLWTRVEFPAQWWKTARQGKRLLVWWPNSETDWNSLRFMLLLSAAAVRVWRDLQAIHLLPDVFQ